MTSTTTAADAMTLTPSSASDHLFLGLAAGFAAMVVGTIAFHRVGGAGWGAILTHFYTADVKEWWGGLTIKQKAAGCCSIVAVLLTFWAAIASGNAGPPPLLLAVLAAVAQFGAAGLFAAHGKADPVHVRRSFERLGLLARRASAAEALATEALEQGFTLVKTRDAMGKISVHLSFLEEGAIEAARDWAAFNTHMPELTGSEEP